MVTQVSVNHRAGKLVYSCGLNPIVKVVNVGIKIKRTVAI